MNEVCNDVALAGILKAFKNVLMLIQIIGPILCIVGLVVLFIRLMHNPDEKNGYKKKPAMGGPPPPGRGRQPAGSSRP